jgi:hypothetical protein
LYLKINLQNKGESNMKLFIYISLLLMSMTMTVQADVFKCKLASGKISYQVSPCPSGTAAQEVVKTKEMSAEEVEAAKTKLKAWQDEQATLEAAKKQAEKEQLEQLQREESLALQRRAVVAQERQMVVDQRPNNQGYGFVPNPYNRYPYNNTWGGYNYPPYQNPGPYPHPPHHHHHDRHDPPNPPPQNRPGGGIAIKR